MFEGHDTTATNMSFTLWLLATHPDIQKRSNHNIIIIIVTVIIIIIVIIMIITIPTWVRDDDCVNFGSQELQT